VTHSSFAVVKYHLVLCLSIAAVGYAQAPDQVDESLKRSQFCAKAAEEFFAGSGLKGDSFADSQSYKSHFNKKLSKCLVKIQRIILVWDHPGERLEMNHIYDALDGEVLGGTILTKKMVNGEDKLIRMVILKEQKDLRDPKEREAALVWLDDLMIQ